MAADKEAIGLSRVHMYEPKCILPLRDNFLFFLLQHMLAEKVILLEQELSD